MKTIFFSAGLLALQASATPFQAALLLASDSLTFFRPTTSRVGTSANVSRKPRRDRKGGEGSILDVLRGDDKFSKLVDILEQNRGLRDDLESTDRKVTLFAPTNQAIRKMEEEFESMRRRPSAEEIVRYHLLADNWKENDMFDGMTLQTELKLRELNNNRQRIRVFKFHGDLLLNMYARIEEADLEAQNGVVHAIDRVLVPPVSDMNDIHLK
jgi:uncharacterized surface protein with fasciclin (FAS1) repeats